jgi:predicted O-methyltransferase YrrM
MKNVLRRMAGRVRRLRHRAETPLTNITYAESGNQWFSPVLAGASTLAPHVSGSAAVRRALATLERVDCDAYHRFVINFYRTGLLRFGDGWRYADLYTTLSALASTLQPRTYLEVGVRRGNSMAMVAAHAPSCQIVGFDLWIENYAGLTNPGKEFVRGQLARVEFAGTADFIDGDSARTVPEFFRTHPDRYFDLVTIDGDHSDAGATTDLRNVLSRIALGGVVVFDDVVNPAHTGLRDVWQRTVAADSRFSSWMFDEAGYGVAFAVRVRP